MGELHYNLVLLTGYWLDNITPEEREKLEEDYFNNDELFIELLDVKDQLTSDYLSGRLVSPDRERFERLIMTSPDYRKQFELERFFQSASTRNSRAAKVKSREKAPTRWQTILAGLQANRRPLTGVAIAALLLVGFISLRPLFLTPTDDKQAEVSNTPSQTFAGQPIVTLSLKRGQRRSQGETAKATIGTVTHTVELQLDVKGRKYSHYLAKLNRLGGSDPDLIASSEPLTETAGSDPPIVTWKLPASSFSVGDYFVSLSGINDDNSTNPIGDYYFYIR